MFESVRGMGWDAHKDVSKMHLGDVGGERGLWAKWDV